MGKSASSEDHELAGRFLEARALCLDLAREHASTIVENKKRGEVRQRYEAIAKSFYCGRVKRRSLFQKVMLNKAVEQFLKSRHEEERLEEDLWAVYHDPHYSIELRRAKLQEIDQLRKRSEQLAEQQHDQLVELSLGTGYHRSKSERLIYRFKRDGRDKFFDRLESAIRRYLKARIEGAHWAGSTPPTRLAASMSLFQLLVLEWLRDKEELWRFLEECLSRWQTVTDPKGMHQQSIMMHNICETGIALDANGNNVIDPNQKILWQIAAMQGVGAVIEPNQSTIDRLRQRSSRNINKAKAYFRQTNPVTDIGAARA
jgi:hypothetical protein